MLQIEGRQWFCDPRVPMLLPPDREFSLHWFDDSPQLVVSIPNELVDQVSTGMFGESGSSLPLPPTFSLTSASGRALVADLALAHEDVNSGAVDGFPRFLSHNVAEGLIARILLSATEHTRAPASAPSAAFRAQTKLVSALLDYLAMPEALHSSTLHIAEQLRVPLRTLQENVQRELGISLTEVVRRNRLRAARAMLIEADPTQTSVTDVALKCGFWHLGRFSVEYREIFGEKPSETLRLLA